MNDLQVFETLCPETLPLTESDRASMRSELFGAAATPIHHRIDPRHDGSTGDATTGSIAGLDLTSGPATFTQHDAGPGRRWMWVAAAALVIAGIAGVWAVGTNRSGDESPAPSQQPATASSTASEETTTPSGLTDTVPPEQALAASSEPTSFPVLDDLPAGLSATAYVQHIADGVTTLRTEALFGRRVDGVLTDPVYIVVQATSFGTSPAAGHPATDAVVMGEPARVMDRTSISGDQVYVVWGSGPYFLASGADPLAFLNQTDPGAIRAEAVSDADQPPQLSIGSLPDGFELIAGPQAFGQATLNATLSIGADNYDVSVSTRNPVMQMALLGPLRSIEVAGRPAWTFLSSFPYQGITWQVDDSTYAYLKVNDGTDAAAALELADRITFVDFDTWTARYPSDTINVSATTEPAED